MKHFWENHIVKNSALILGVLVLLGGTIYFGEYRRQKLLSYVKNTEQELTMTKDELKKQTADLNENIGGVKNQLLALVDLLGTEQNKSAGFQEQLGKVADTIGTLDSLSKTDPQLLEKYSKVYFLNEHYVPKELIQIDQQYMYEKTRTLQIHAQVWPFLQKMLAGANQSGLQLQVASAYRSFGTQASLKAAYKVTYGTTKANQFSADQGYSEHQLGTTLDFTTPAIGGELTGFEKTKESDWLIANAYQYGFILSYPNNNTYYIYEPWHWRFVGVDLATRLHREGKYFYDIDQRTIDSYLAVLFN